jgi:hypothetical protein
MYHEESNVPQTDAEMSKHIDGSLETVRGDVPNLHEGRLYIAFLFCH